jgi:hypothetical protein
MSVTYTNLESMLRVIRGRTKKMNDDQMLVDELNESTTRVWGRVYPACTEIQITFETTGTFAAETQEFDLSAVISTAGGEFYAHKTFYIMDGNQNKYVAVVFMDANDGRFQSRQQEQAQVMTPVFASAVNFGTIVFAPALPAGTQWRSDWIGKPPKFSLATNCVTSFPDPLVQPITDDAIATIFNTLDDTREAAYRARFEDNIISAVHGLKRRQNQTPQRTAPFPARRASGQYGWGP